MTKAPKASRRKRCRVVTPQTLRLGSLPEEVRTRHRQPGVDTALLNSRGPPWATASYGRSFGRIHDAAGVFVDDEGDRRARRQHDVRDTFCTMLLTEWELGDRAATEIMNWSPEQVANFRKVYVDHPQVVVALDHRIAAEQVARALRRYRQVRETLTDAGIAQW